MKKPYSTTVTAVQNGVFQHVQIDDIFAQIKNGNITAERAEKTDLLFTGVFEDYSTILEPSELLVLKFRKFSDPEKMSLWRHKLANRPDVYMVYGDIDKGMNAVIRIPKSDKQKHNSLYLDFARLLRCTELIKVSNSWTQVCKFYADSDAYINYDCIPFTGTPKEPEPEFNEPIEIQEHLEQIDLQTEEGKIHALLQAALLDPTEETEEEPAYIYAEVIDGDAKKMFSEGNLSVISGEAKSRKTFFCAAVTAAAITSNPQHKVCYLSGNLPEEKRHVLYFDTEQSKHHAQKVNRRILAMTEQERADNFHYYKLRGHDAETCLKMIVHAITRTHGGRVGFVVIDGIADLLSEGINSESEANAVILELMRITEEHKIHVCTVLHVNKGRDKTLTGWIGTQLLKKAETVVKVTKDESTANVSHVTPEQTRDIAFDSFAFEVNEDGIPQATTRGAKNKQGIFESVPPNEIGLMLLRIPEGLSKMQYESELTAKVKQLKIPALKPSRERIKELLERLESEGIISEKRHETNHRKKIIERNNAHAVFENTTE